MTSGGNNIDDFPENQLTEFRGLDSIETNQGHVFFCSKQDFS